MPLWHGVGELSGDSRTKVRQPAIPQQLGGGQAVARHAATQTNHQEPGAISAQNRQGTFGVGSGRFGSGDVSTICEGSRIGLPNKGIIGKGKGMMGMAWTVQANYATPLAFLV